MSSASKEFVVSESRTTHNGGTQPAEKCYPRPSVCLVVISALCAVEKLGVPGHLDGFQFPLVGFLRVVLKVGQFDDVLVEVGETDRQRVDFGMRLGQQNADIFGVVPG